MRQKKLTLIIPVREGKEDELRTLLKAIGDDVARNTILRLSSSTSTHFARFVLFDREPKQRLLFSACYSGSTESYLNELARNLGDGLDLIFSNTDGYSRDTWKSQDKAIEFVRRHDVGHQMFAMAFPNTTADEIVQSRIFRAAFNDLLDVKEVRDVIEKLYPSGLELPKPGTTSRSGVAPIWDWVDGFFVRNRTEFSNDIVNTRRELFEMEDRVVQNQMTVVSPTNAGFTRWLRRIVLFVAQLRARRSGTLSGLPMVHFAQWSILGGGGQLLFESNYDGTWEKYIDDFVDNAYPGLDMIWGNSPDYPPGGARNIEAFKSGIRKYQYPAQIFYSAYPDCTVQNVFDDLALCRAVKMTINDPAVRMFLSGSHAQRIVP